MFKSFLSTGLLFRILDPLQFELTNFSGPLDLS